MDRLPRWCGRLPQRRAAMKNAIWLTLFALAAVVTLVAADRYQTPAPTMELVAAPGR